MENSETLQKEIGILTGFCATLRRNYIAFELGNAILCVVILLVFLPWLSNHYTPERMLMGEFAMSMIGLTVLCFSVIPCYIAEQTALQEDETDEDPLKSDNEEETCSSSLKKGGFSITYTVSCACFTAISISFFCHQIRDLINGDNFHMTYCLIGVIWLVLCIYGCVNVSKKMLMLPEF